MFKSIKFSASILTGCLLACTTAKNKPVSIHFMADSSRIAISNIEEAGLYQIKSKLNDTTYQNLVSVLQTPAEDDSTSMEMEWPGKLSIQGDSLIFTPEKPFEKGKDYLVQTIINVQFAGTKDIVKADVGHYVKPQQIILHR